jgi:hypothetical protein
MLSVMFSHLVRETITALSDKQPAFRNLPLSTCRFSKMPPFRAENIDGREPQSLQKPRYFARHVTALVAIDLFLVAQVIFQRQGVLIAECHEIGNFTSKRGFAGTATDVDNFHGFVIGNLFFDEIASREVPWTERS